MGRRVRGMPRSSPASVCPASPFARCSKPNFTLVSSGRGVFSPGRAPKSPWQKGEQILSRVECQHPALHARPSRCCRPVPDRQAALQNKGWPRPWKRVCPLPSLPCSPGSASSSTPARALGECAARTGCPAGCVAGAGTMAACAAAALLPERLAPVAQLAAGASCCLWLGYLPSRFAVKTDNGERWLLTNAHSVSYSTQARAPGWRPPRQQLALRMPASFFFAARARAAQRLP